jgi:hypothetical protein
MPAATSLQVLWGSNLGSMTNLDTLGFYNNPYLSGTLSNELTSLCKLRVVNLANTSIPGNIVEGPGNLSSLQYLVLLIFENDHVSTIPNALGFLTNPW